MSENLSEQHPARKSSKTTRALIRFVVKLAVISCLLFVLLQFVLGIYVAHTNDMFPAVRDGDLCITYRLQPWAYNDTVAYTVDGQRHFGRIVGLPGDKIDMDAFGTFTVNGAMPYESIYYTTTTVDGSAITFPYSVEANEVFVLNDFRDQPGDSRMYGAIPKSDLDGTLVLLLRRRGF